MNVEVKYFGMIAEHIGIDTECFEFKVVKEKNLRDYFNLKYPLIASMNYKIAINQEINDIILEGQKNAEIALLPPFAGG